MQRNQSEEKVLQALREAVGEALERKRRLGQYAVFWEDGAASFCAERMLLSRNRNRIESRKRKNKAEDKHLSFPDDVLFQLTGSNSLGTPFSGPGKSPGPF